ncbi:uncharacterized protein N7484_010293 [Penicillium longicatenatum]|uniref:uncharacterized protein n=1 Tax=Penicillium longicatenatum TaxID=1561947 RepID=UPI002548FCDE|nr:uncharacterized protein N7484_010293 [Penicillium longicatenatum]KAJ5630193.1 hypothetical protein N7484_010293 [Penicillium longicatenatum]
MCGRRALLCRRITGSGFRNTHLFQLNATNKGIAYNFCGALVTLLCHLGSQKHDTVFLQPVYLYYKSSEDP